MTEKQGPLYIVIDTNFIHDSPDLNTQKVRAVLDVARKTGAKVCLPMPVKVEATQKYREALTSASSDLRAVANELGRLKVSNPPADVDISALVQAYEERVSVSIQEKGIVEFPFASPPIEKLFDLASKKEPPFDSNGGSFRDGVIYFTVLALSQKEECTVIFETEDKRFRERIMPICPKNLVPMSHEELMETLKNFESKRQQERRQMLETVIAQDISDNRKAEITSFITKNGTFKVEENYFGEELTSLDSFELSNAPIKVKDLVENGNSLTYLAKLRGTLRYKVKTSTTIKKHMRQGFTRALATPNQVGQTRATEPAPSPLDSYDMPWSNTPFLEQQEAIFDVEIECASQLGDKGQILSSVPVKVAKTERDIMAEVVQRKQSSGGGSLFEERK